MRTSETQQHDNIIGNLSFALQNKQCHCSKPNLYVLRPRNQAWWCDLRIINDTLTASEIEVIISKSYKQNVKYKKRSAIVHNHWKFVNDNLMHLSLSTLAFIMLGTKYIISREWVEYQGVTTDIPWTWQMAWLNCCPPELK